MWVKLLTHLQILGCELHKLRLAAKLHPGPDGGAIALPRPSSRYKGKGREGRGRKGLGIKRGNGTEGREGREGVVRDGKGKGWIGRKGRVRGEGAEGGERVGKGKGWLDLDLSRGSRVPS